MKSIISVVLIQNFFATYRKFVYDEINKSFNFTVLHPSNGNLIVPEISTPYSKKIKQFKYNNKNTNSFLWVFNKLHELKPDIIIHEFAVGILSLPFTFLYARIIGAKFILWSHGYDRKKGFNPSTNFLDKYRLWLMIKSDALILYGQKDKKLLSSYIDSSKIFVAQNTLDTKNHTVLRDILNNGDRQALKRELNFNTNFNLISIGRLYKEKKSELIIDVFEEINSLIPNVCSLHFIGDGEDLPVLKKMAIEKRLQDKIVFHGAIYDDKLNGKLLFASDMMIMTGPVGLSVVHSFSFDCPVIAFNGNNHGPEIEYIVDGETGFLIEEKSVPLMAKKIISYIESPLTQKIILKNIRAKLESELGVEKMVNGILCAIEYVSKNRNK